MQLPRQVQLRDGSSARLRRARPEDAEAHIERTNRIGAERVYTLTERLGRTLEEVRAQFRDADPRTTLWLVAEVGGEVVGGANFRRGTWAKNAHTADLGVAILPAHRGRGLGEALMRAGIDWAREVGVRKLKLGVFATNERAIRLYRRLGFVEEARLRGEVVLQGEPVDELLFALWLAPEGTRGADTAPVRSSAARTRSVGAASAASTSGVRDVNSSRSGLG